MASVVRLSYQKRLFLLLMSFFWTMIVCFIVFQYYRERQCKADVLDAQLQIYHQQLLDSIDRDCDYRYYVDRIKHPFEELRVTVVDRSGKVLYDSVLDANALDNHLTRPEIAQALRYGSGYRIGRRSASDGREYFYSATKGRHILVRSAIPYTAGFRELLKADWAFLWILFLMSLVLSVLAYFTTRRIGRTVERLNQFAAKAERGETFDGTESFPDDELGAISDHIVKLYEHKRQLTENINHELKTPVASIQVCLETLLSGIELSDEKRKDLIGRCYANTERLRHLLADVSLITRMEDGSQSIDREMVQVNGILQEISEELEALPEEQKMTMHIDIGEPVIIYGNHSLISSIFHNLTENALAYSGGKDIFVSLLSHGHGVYRICFEDNGCGVEEEKLSRLFERFYRVDKGRSRQKGGTGLGLSIVKHAILFHGGTVSVDNGSAGGLRFIFSFPDASHKNGSIKTDNDERNQHCTRRARRP
ncbi:MAG: HAMP domain-containing histidine kinase [Bacteroidales bacterium]|nr:HAMP domain-containing histidine kinase [Bacteroidales bacterium]